MGWILALIALLSSGCASSTAVAPTGIPATILLTATVVAGPPPPTASIIATVHDAGGQPVPGIPVNFSTTSGFITSGGLTDGGGNVQAFLTGTATGSPATVTAIGTSGTQTVTATTVVHF